MIFNCDVVEMSVRAAMGEYVGTELKDGALFYATLNLHAEKNGIFEGVQFDDSVEKYIIRKNIYKKPGDRVNYFSNAADAIGIVFFRFPDQETMISMEEHMNEHVRILFRGDDR